MMYFFRHGVALAALVLMAGCASVPINPLGLNRVATMRLEAVDVQVAPDATVWWGQAERDFAEKHGAEVTAELRKTKVGAEEVEKNASSAVANSPAAQEYIRQEAARRLQSGLLREVSAEMHGQEPVRIDVTIHQVVMPSAAQRAVLGGQPILRATVRLTEARSGKEIAAYPNLTVAINAGNGVLGVMVDQFATGDHFDELVAKFSTQYRQWLIKT